MMTQAVTPPLNVSSETYDDDYFVELMPTWGYAASAFVLFLIGFFGFFLNLIVILLMCRDKQLWTPLNVILFNLVCSDFSVSILGNPFTLVSALSHHWVFGKTMCVMYGFFMTLLGITSITTLTVLSFERYIMVSRPLASHRLSMRGAWFSICMIWCYSIVVTTPPLFGWGSYVNEAANISCSINWEEQTTNALSYILFLFAMGLVLPLIIIIFSYLNIVRTMKNNTLRMGKVARAESRITVMVFVMIVTFMIAWTPYSILALIEQFAPRDLISPGLGVIPALVAKSSICYDPIIYVGMNSQFRAYLKRVFMGDQEDSIQGKGIENTLMSPTNAASHHNDNNITLQYLNPNNNTMVAVTIYQVEEDEYNKLETCEADKIKKNKIDKKKKVTLMMKSLEEESSEFSADSYAKDISSGSSTRRSVRLREQDDSFEGPTTVEEVSSKPNSSYEGDIFEETVERDGFEASDLLIDHAKLSRGFENAATDMGSSERLPRRNSSVVVNRLDHHESRYRRKSSMGSLVPGHLRKFASATQETRGGLNRLLVDERDRSKLMNFEDIKGRKASGREQMM